MVLRSFKYILISVTWFFICPSVTIWISQVITWGNSNVQHETSISKIFLQNLLIILLISMCFYYLALYFFIWFVHSFLSHKLGLIKIKSMIISSNQTILVLINLERRNNNISFGSKESQIQTRSVLVTDETQLEILNLDWH